MGVRDEFECERPQWLVSSALTMASGSLVRETNTARYVRNRVDLISAVRLIRRCLCRSDGNSYGPTAHAGTRDREVGVTPFKDSGIMNNFSMSVL